MMEFSKCWIMQNRWGGGNLSIMNWEIIPNESINGMRFGMERSDVRKILGKPKRVFKKTNEAVNTTDAYLDFHVYYSSDDRLEAIEFFGNNINLCINSHTVFPGSLKVARNVLPDLEDLYGSFISKSSSIGISTDEDIIISILAGCKDYYK